MDPDAQDQPTIAHRLATWTTELSFEALPPPVLDMARKLVLDQIGLQIRGATLPHVQPQRRYVAALEAREESTVTGSARRSAASLAAYVNGTMGHSMEFDDSHMLTWHSSSVVVPAAFALAEREGSTGAAVLTAIIAGQQVMSLISAVTNPALMADGWHAPRTLGGFAAAAVAGRLMGLTAAQIADAFGIAASDASGPMEYDQAGGEVKRQHSGSAARSGIEAAELARLGLTGPPEIFEGKRGVFALFGRTRDSSPLDDAWDHWHILDSFFRLTPGVATVLPVVDVIAELQSLRAVHWSDVEAVNVGMPAFSVGHSSRIVHPANALSAHFSLAFAVALRLVTGASAPEAYIDPGMWNDEAIWSTSERVHAFATEFAADMPMLSAQVEIKLTDGTSFVRMQPGFHGHAVSPASDKDLEAKFRRNAAGIISDEASTEIIELVSQLEHLKDISRLMALLR